MLMASSHPLFGVPSNTTSCTGFLPFAPKDADTNSVASLGDHDCACE